MQLCIVVFFSFCLLSNTKYSLPESTTSPNRRYPKTVWMFYDQQLTAGLDILVNKTITTLSERYSVRYLTLSNVSQYVNLFELPKVFPQLDSAHKGDILRIYLLSRWGGWWIDFSTLVNDVTFLDRWYNRTRDSQADFMAFGPANSLNHEITTSLMYAPEHSSIMHLWMSETLKLWDQGCLCYMYNTFRSGVAGDPGIFKHYPIVQYYTIVNYAFQNVRQRLMPRSTTIVMEANDKAQFALWKDCGNDFARYKVAVLKQLEHPTYPIIKLWGRHRRYIWPNSPYERWKPDDPHIFVPGIPILPGNRRIWIGSYALAGTILLLTVFH